MPFGFHGPELIIVLVIALLIFGPKKLPEMGSSIGKSIKEFKKGISELSNPKEEKETPSAASLESIEREIASKKAAANAREAEQPEVEVASNEKSVD
jgi:sec-independent protein translocase protein TatA